jgi:hypothetical protein
MDILAASKQHSIPSSVETHTVDFSVSSAAPLLGIVLRPSQYCGVPGNAVFEAVDTVREMIAHAEVTRAPLCILSLDFNEAFDRISHTYLFNILRIYGFSERFTRI